MKVRVVERGSRFATPFMEDYEEKKHSMYDFMRYYDPFFMFAIEGLCGDFEKDVLFLAKEYESFKDHVPEGKIRQNCMFFLQTVYPDEMGNEAIPYEKVNRDMIERIVNEADTNIRKSRFADAEELLEKAIRIVEDIYRLILRHDPEETCEYHSFDEYFEEFIYRYLYSSGKKVVSLSIPYARIYRMYGAVLVNLEKYEQAEAAYKESLKWNPVNAEATFEYLDLIKRLGREDEFFKETIEVFLFIFRPEHIAKCYRNLGYYFMKNRKWQEAANCYLLSLRYDDADEKEIRLVLDRIKQESEMKSMLLSEEKMNEINKTYGVPIGANAELVSMACCLGDVFLKQKKHEKAEYMFKIGTSLLSSDEILRMFSWMDERNRSLRRGQRPAVKLSWIYHKGRSKPSCYEARLEGFLGMWLYFTRTSVRNSILSVMRILKANWRRSYKTGDA